MPKPEAVQVFHGDCLTVLRNLPAESFDAVITDPPYGLSDHKPAEVVACLTAWLAGEEFRPKAKGGFMNRSWDAWVPGPEVWREVLRVLKPGGHACIFAGTRSMDLMSMALRLAGFELRDSIGSMSDGGGAPLLAWVTGQGFPKSLDVGKAIDKAGPRGQPAPFAEFAAHYEERRKAAGLTHAQICEAGKFYGAVNHGGSSVNWAKGYGMPTVEQWAILQPLLGLGPRWKKRIERVQYEREVLGMRHVSPGVAFTSVGPAELPITAPGSDAARQWDGWGTALKPAWEPIVLARKPLACPTVAAQVLATGTGALNIDGCRVATNGEVLGRFNNAKPGEHNVNDGHPSAKPLGRMQQEASWIDNSAGKGRWPANLCHDGSPEVLAAFAALGRNPKSGIIPAPDADEILDECVKLFTKSSAQAAGESSPCSTRDALTALTHAVTRASCGGMSLSDTNSLGESATAKSMIALCSSVITTILNIVKSASQGPLLVTPIPCASRARAVVQSAPTGITTITISHWKSDGSADPVTCSITRTSTPIGARIDAANSPARFFPALGFGEDELRFMYSAKASKADRAGSSHPTVKPQRLLRWLSRLITPPGGTILDPFAGSGSLGTAALAEGFSAVLIEREAEYFEDALRRLTGVVDGDMPLFSDKVA